MRSFAPKSFTLRGLKEGRETVCPYCVVPSIRLPDNDRQVSAGFVESRVQRSLKQAEVGYSECMSTRKLRVQVMQGLPVQ